MYVCKEKNCRYLLSAVVLVFKVRIKGQISLLHDFTKDLKVIIFDFMNILSTGFISILKGTDLCFFLLKMLESPALYSYIPGH